MWGRMTPVTGWCLLGCTGSASAVWGGDTMTDTSTATAVFDWDSPPPVGGTEHALWLAHWHFQFENPEQLHMLVQLYHDDIVWEVPSRRVIHYGKREVLENYARIFESCAEPKIEPGRAVCHSAAGVRRSGDDLQAGR